MAGLALFGERGLRARSADIARRAGVAVGTLYLHFGDKTGLARQILDHAVDELRGRLRAADEAAAARNRVRARAEALVLYAEERRAFARVLFAGDIAGSRLGTDVLDQLAATHEKRLRDGVATGESRGDVDPAAAAQALVGMQARLLAWWLADEGRAPREIVVDTLAKLEAAAMRPERARSVRRNGGKR